MTRLSDNTVERLKGLDIKDVADRLGIELGRGNANARCFNQEAHAHGDRHGSLGFNPRTNTFKCFACGVSGDTIALVMQYNKVDFREACEWLATSYGIMLEGVEPRANREKKPDYTNRRIYRDDTEPLRLTKSLLDYESENQEIYQALYDLSDERSVYCSARCERQFWRFVTKKHPTHLTNYPSEKCYRWIEEHENAKARDISDVAGL